MKRFVVLFQLCLLVFPLASVSGQDLLQQANMFYGSLKMDKALRAYKQVLASDGISDQDKADACMKISRIFFKAYLMVDSAISYAEKGLTLRDDDRRREFLKQLTEYALASGDFSGAERYSRLLLQHSPGRKDQLEAKNTMLDVGVSEIEHLIESEGRTDYVLLDSSIRLAGEINHLVPESPQNNEKRLELFLLKGDVGSAYKALRDYFFIGNDTIITRYYQGYIAEFESLAGRINSSEPSDVDKILLVHLLGKFRFYDMASLLARYYQLPDKPEIKEQLTYAGFRKAFEKVVFNHYSGILAGKENDGQFERQLDYCYQFLCAGLPECAGKPYNQKLLLKIAAEKFGMQSFCKERGDYHIYLLGESIYETNATVEQYGYKAPFRFCQLDHLIGTHVNGYYYDYFDWGGWSENGIVIENRKLLLEGAISQYEKVSGKSQAEIDSLLNQLGARDDKLLKDKDMADLPGLRTRFEYLALLAVRNSLMKDGFSEEELRMNMICKLKMNDYLSGTLAHEGRHVIDTKNGFAGKDHVQSEFAANLSSVIFAPVPQMSLSRVFIYAPGEKDPTGHKAADTRIVEGFLEWMKMHRTEIQGYDPERPLLSQADQLSNQQIMDICRNLDPLNKMGICQTAGK